MTLTKASSRIVGRVGSQRVLFAIRTQSTSTMGNVTCSNGFINEMSSTLSCEEKKDFSTSVATINEDTFVDEQLNAIFSTAQISNHSPRSNHVNALALEMNLVQASEVAKTSNSFDKILLLISHGEAANEDLVECENSSIDTNPFDPSLTAKGIGQMLNLSRKTAAFCTKDRLVPELCVVSPLRRATEAALLTFPQYNPCSVNSIPWVCHSGCMEHVDEKLHDVVSSVDELETCFPGVDYSYLKDDSSVTNVPVIESKGDLLKRSDEFLAWLKGRKERVIVVSSHPSWLQSFCGASLRYYPEVAGREEFKTGEMRSIGVKFIDRAQVV